MTIFDVKAGRILTPGFRSTFGAVFKVTFEEGVWEIGTGAVAEGWLRSGSGRFWSENRSNFDRKWSIFDDFRSILDLFLEGFGPVLGGPLGEGSWEIGPEPAFKRGGWSGRT